MRSGREEKLEGGEEIWVKIKIHALFLTVTSQTRVCTQVLPLPIQTHLKIGGKLKETINKMKTTLRTGGNTWKLTRN